MVATLGVVYTPRKITAPMVDRALAPLIAGKLPAEILALRVCDFAIGEGAFLVEIVRVLAAAHGGRDAKQQVAAHCLHGADIDPAAVATARATVEAFVGAPVPELEAHLRVGDALALAWPAFDAVIGNPPYIRQEKISPETKRALRGYASYDGAADLYVYFIELAQRITRPGGRYCVIVPSKWLTAAYARPLRALLAETGSVDEVLEVERDAFAGIDAFPCVVIGTIGGPPADVRAGRLETVSPVERVTVPIGNRDSKTLHAVKLVKRYRPHAGEPWHLEDPEIARLEARWPALGDVVTAAARGVVTGCNRAFVISAEQRARILEDDPACNGLIRPFVKGRDVRRWRAATSDRFVIMLDRGTTLPPALERYLVPMRAALEPGSGRKPGTYAWYELQDPVGALAKSRAPRLFYQDIQTAPACALDETGLVPDTTVWVLGTADRFVLALLNSQFYAWYARRRFPPALNGAVRPKLEYLRKLPLAEPTPELRARITELVEAQLVAVEPARDRELDALIAAAYSVSGSLM